MHIQQMTILHKLKHIAQPHTYHITDTLKLQNEVD